MCVMPMKRRSNALPPVDERLIISIYDYSGAWSEPYVRAGYPVIRWDKKIEGDILTDDAWRELTGHRDYVYGLLAAPPCTYFASSGARWWDRIPDADLMGMVALAQFVLILKEQYDNLVFWGLENPVGRIERLIPELKPYRRMSFDPCDFGDPYTKKTILWGEFNERLYKTPVLPLYGSMMHKIPGGAMQAERRSATPAGFANAFYQVNQ
jgi:hypothetical protein